MHTGRKKCESRFENELIKCILFLREREKNMQELLSVLNMNHHDLILNIFSFFYGETSKLPQYTYLMHELNSRLHMDALAASLKLLTTVVWRCKCKILDFSQWIIHWNGHKTMNSQLKKMFSIFSNIFIGCHGEFIFSDL